MRREHCEALLGHSSPLKPQVDAPISHLVRGSANGPLCGRSGSKFDEGLAGWITVCIQASFEGEHSAELAKEPSERLLGVFDNLRATFESVCYHPN